MLWLRIKDKVRLEPSPSRIRVVTDLEPISPFLVPPSHSHPFPQFPLSYTLPFTFPFPSLSLTSLRRRTRQALWLPSLCSMSALTRPSPSLPSMTSLRSPRPSPPSLTPPLTLSPSEHLSYHRSHQPLLSPSHTSQHVCPLAPLAPSSTHSLSIYTTAPANTPTTSVGCTRPMPRSASADCSHVTASRFDVPSRLPSYCPSLFALSAFPAYGKWCNNTRRIERRLG